MKIKFKKMHPDAIIPKHNLEGDAGLDLTAVSKEFDAEHQVMVYDTGVAVELPVGHVGLLCPRSSISDVSLYLANSVGIVDENFRGSIKAKFRATDYLYKSYEVGDRICQLVVVPYIVVEPVEVSELSPSVRGDAGFGSSNKQ